LTERIYAEAYITKSLGNKGTWETDDKGNPIVIIEASNEDLDYQGESVLQTALLNSKEYFLQNGVVSYDHKHLPSPEVYKYDPEWNAEKYVLGKPLSAKPGINKDGKATVFVKAALYKSNKIAQEIISKLADGIGTVKASVGGRRVVKEDRFNPTTLSAVPTIVSVDWDEVALTYKPVNQTLGPTVLSPSAFVKSLTAGSSVNPATMDGGNALQTQGSIGLVESLGEKIRSKKISIDQVIDYLDDSGASDARKTEIIEMLTKYVKGEVMDGENKDTDTNVQKSTDELLKALDSLEKAKSDMGDGAYIRKGGHFYKKGANGKMQKVDEDAPEWEDDDDNGGDMGKSIDGAVSVATDTGEDIIDVTEVFGEMEKSLGEQASEIKELGEMVKSLSVMVKNQNEVLSAMGKVVVEDNGLLKAMGDAPQPRITQNNLNVQPRFKMEKSLEEKVAKLTPQRLAKSMVDNGVDGVTQSQVNVLARRGNMVAVAQAFPEVIEKAVKEL
jgi:hypothetical protein